MSEKFRISKKLTAIIPITLFLVMAFSLTPVTHAYGRTHLWQVAVSENCNNPSLCGGGGGGFWLWAEFDSGGQGDATGTGCGHLVPALGFAGANHFNADITGWTVAAGSAGPLTFFVTGGTQTLTGHTGGSPITVPIIGNDGINPASPSNPLDTGIPAVAGHFSFHPAPGIAGEITVVQMH